MLLLTNNVQVGHLLYIQKARVDRTHIKINHPSRMHSNYEMHTMLQKRQV